MVSDTPATLHDECIEICHTNVFELALNMLCTSSVKCRNQEALKKKLLWLMTLLCSYTSGLPQEAAPRSMFGKQIIKWEVGSISESQEKLLLWETSRDLQWLLLDAQGWQGCALASPEAACVHAPTPGPSLQPGGEAAASKRWSSPSVHNGGGGRGQAHQRSTLSGQVVKGQP